MEREMEEGRSQTHNFDLVTTGGEDSNEMLQHLFRYQTGTGPMENDPRGLQVRSLPETRSKENAELIKPRRSCMRRNHRFFGCHPIVSALPHSNCFSEELGHFKVIYVVGEEAMIHWNGPPLYAADDLLESALDRHFTGKKSWHFITRSNKPESVLIS
eukprot:gene17229-18950_t